MSTSSVLQRVRHSTLLATSEAIWRMGKSLMLHLKRNKDAEITQEQVDKLDDCYQKLATVLNEIQGA